MTERPLTATVSDKGQITIPQALRYRLDIRPGEVLEIAEEAGRLVARKQQHRAPLDRVYGILQLDRGVDDLVAELRGDPDVP